VILPALVFPKKTIFLKVAVGFVTNKEKKLEPRIFFVKPPLRELSGVKNMEKVALS
jgi:hypothetical protein